MLKLPIDGGAGHAEQFRDLRLAVFASIVHLKQERPLRL